MPTRPKAHRRYFIEVTINGEGEVRHGEKYLCDVDDLYGYSFESFKEQLDGYIDYWNTRRYQTRLKGMTPVQYRGHPKRAA